MCQDVIEIQKKLIKYKQYGKLPEIIANEFCLGQRDQL